MLRRAKSVENINRDEKAIEDRKKHVKNAQLKMLNPIDVHRNRELQSTQAIVSSMFR